MEKKIILSNYQKKIILILLIFIMIRIPVALIEDNIILIKDFIQGLEKGNIIYCEIDNSSYGKFFFEKPYPPGIYIYLIAMYFLFFNFFLIFLELVNSCLIYKLIKKNRGSKAALNSLIFITFFPISIMNTGFTIDPIQVSLFFILVSYISFSHDKIILSAISCALGTLIIYIPAVLIVPILFYYIKQKKWIEGFKFLTSLGFTILICIVPFLLACPNKFILTLSSSLNQPQSLNYLENTGFFPSFLQLIPIVAITMGEININITILTVIQILIILFALVYTYLKYDFRSKKDIIPCIIFLIFMIKIATFYIHFRFIYWIFMLGLLTISLKTNTCMEERVIIFLGFVNFGFTMLIYIISTLSIIQLAVFINIVQAGLIITILSLSFIIIGLNFSISKKSSRGILGKLIFYSVLFMAYFSVYMIMKAIFYEIENILLLNFCLIGLFSMEIITGIKFLQIKSFN